MTTRVHVDVPAHPNFFYRHELRTEGWASTTPGAEYRVALIRIGQEGRGTVCATHAPLDWAAAADMVDYLYHLASMLSNPASRTVFHCGPLAPCDICGKEISPGPGPHITVDRESGRYLTCHGHADAAAKAGALPPDANKSRKDQLIDEYVALAVEVATSHYHSDPERSAVIDPQRAARYGILAAAMDKTDFPEIDRRFHARLRALGLSLTQQ